LLLFSQGEPGVTDPPQSSAKPEGLLPEQIALVRRHLLDVLSSRAFAGSKRAQEFLQLVVEHALTDPTASLKERMIGAEMFGRPVDYDTANDAVVRVKATEVRRRLVEYYRDSPAEPAVRIDLPVGSYGPGLPGPEPKQRPSPSRFRRTLSICLYLPAISPLLCPRRTLNAAGGSVGGPWSRSLS
jgi:hypothetical protein